MAQDIPAGWTEKKSSDVSQHAIVTAIGADRPGLVEELSRFIFDRGGNIEDSRMVNLRGQFAMMVLIAGPPETLQKIRLELGPLAHHSRLHAELRPADPLPQPVPAPPPESFTSSLPPSRPACAAPYRLTATALDQAGLVHRVSHLLRTLGANIENLETHLTAAPYTGSSTFEMELAMSLPPQTPISRLREQLGKLCDELNIDWQVTAL